MKGYVYFISGDPFDFVKIGFTRSNPFARLKEIQTGCPDQLFVETYVQATMDDERRLHETFDFLHYRGEWFIKSHKLNDLIEYMTESGERLEAECSRQRFEDGIWDVVITGFTHPDDPNPQHYERSGDGSLWRHMHPDMEEA